MYLLTVHVLGEIWAQPSQVHGHGYHWEIWVTINKIINSGPNFLRFYCKALVVCFRMLKGIELAHPRKRAPYVVDLQKTCPSVSDIQNSFDKLKDLCMPGKW